MTRVWKRIPVGRLGAGACLTAVGITRTTCVQTEIAFKPTARRPPERIALQRSRMKREQHGSLYAKGTPERLTEFTVLEARSFVFARIRYRVLDAHSNRLGAVAHLLAALRAGVHHVCRGLRVTLRRAVLRWPLHTSRAQRRQRRTVSDSSPHHRGAPPPQWAIYPRRGVAGFLTWIIGLQKIWSSGPVGHIPTFSTSTLTHSAWQEFM